METVSRWQTAHLYYDARYEPMNEMRISYLCEKGDVRPNNQDYILCLHSEKAGRMAGLFLVADGMGGLSSGEEISAMIARNFSYWWQEKLDGILKEKNWKEELNQELSRQIQELNAQAQEFGRRLQKKSGSTLSLLLIVDREYFIRHLGDSRIYLYRKKRLTQLTVDQSLVMQIAREKNLTRKEAADMAGKNVLTMCIGIYDVPQFFSADGRIKKRDYFLLCSDGLYNCLSDEEIGQVLADKKIPPEEKAQAARQRIGPGMAGDNISILGIQYDRLGFGNKLWRMIKH